MPLNTTYSLEPDVAIKGLVADSRRGYNTITKVASIDTAHGVLLTLDGSGEAVLPSGVDDYIIGASIWTTTLVQDESGATVWKAGKALPITQEDPIWLESRDAITEGALVYATISGVPGNVKATAGADTTTLPIGRAETTVIGAGELVRVKLLPALQGA